MLSRSLWLALTRPPVDSALNRLIPKADNRHKKRNRLLFIVLVLPTWGILCLLSFGVLFDAPWLAGLLPFGISVLVSGTVFGWTLSLAGLLGHCRERGWWEPLSVLPPGALGVWWTLCHTWMDRHSERFRTNLRTLLFLAGCDLSLMILSTLMPLLAAAAHKVDARTLPDFLGILNVLLPALVMLYGLYLDAHQSAVLAVVTAIVGTVESGSGLQARLVAGGAFAIIQAVLYALMILIGYGLLPRWLTPPMEENPLVNLSLMLARFAVLCGGRELVLALLWRRLTDRLGAMPLSARSASC